MTPDQAADLAARTLDAIDKGENDDDWLAAERERVASDLAGVRLHPAGRFREGLLCSRCPGDDPYPCPDAARYADGLRRTAALYGVTA